MIPPLACPRCPLCGTPPGPAGELLAAISGGVQIVCEVDACEVFLWDGTQADGGLSVAGVMEEFPGEGAGGVTKIRPRDATPEEIERARRSSRES